MATGKRKKSERVRALGKQWGNVLADVAGRVEPARPAAGAMPDPEAWHTADLGACWIGQATTLLRVRTADGGVGPSPPDGVTILTDPNFQERLGVGIGTKRLGRSRSTALPGSIADLPPVDVIILSHAHLDHWDKTSLKKLVHPETRVIVPAKTRRLVPKGFAEVIEVPWGRSVEAGGVRISAIKPRHWGARLLWDRHRGYNAYLLEADRNGGEPLRIFFGGDTAHTDAFDYLNSEHPHIDLAILGIGNSYAPWSEHHATPEQAADMAARMGARRIMPVHHATFRDPIEPVDEPITRLKKVWDHDRIVCEAIGQTWIVADGDAPTAVEPVQPDPPDDPPAPAAGAADSASRKPSR